MTAYEFYVQDETKGKRLIGILPERRTDQHRINDQSIMNWATMVFGTIFNLQDISFIRITLAQNNYGNYYSKEH